MEATDRDRLGWVVSWCRWLCSLNALSIRYPDLEGILKMMLEVK